VLIVGWILAALPLALGIYAYVAYPALLAWLARFRHDGTAPAARQPLVSIVVPAYNEEQQIRGCIEALLAQDYPATQRQILILSDASTDRTDEIVREYRTQGVELLRMPVRGGKTAAENASCAVLRGEIIINSDSSVRLHPSAVRLLVEAMADPNVGVASTRDVSIARREVVGNQTEAGYVDYEMRIRGLETQTGGIVGASGSGYAIRANLHRLPVRADLSRDFSAALTSKLNGYTAVSVDDALCYVPRTGSLRAEYKRKVRTIARGAETLYHNRRLLDPMQYGLFSWKLLSHKVCRWLVPVTGVSLGLVGLIILATTYTWAAVLLGAVVAGFGVAAAGAVIANSRPLPRLLSIVTFGVAANIAVVHALVRVVVGHEDHLWEPTRRAPIPEIGVSA
jgi:glycosyltransferase involved in cell wall biosynthesis